MDIIIKPSSLVDIENILTLAQRKVLNVLLEHSRQNIHDSQTYSLHIRTIREKAGQSLFESNTDVFEQIRAIVDLPPIEVNIFGTDKKYPTRVVANLLAQAVYDKEHEVVSWVYPPFIYEMLKRYNTIQKSDEIGMYTKLPLAVQAKFSSKHALALWEFCRSRFDEKRGYAESPFITIEELNKLFHCNYDSWFKLNANIISKAIQDIHLHEPTYFILVREQKARHKVIAVKFIIQQRLFDTTIAPKNNQKTPQTLFDEIAPSAIDKKRNAAVEKYLGTLSTEQQERIMAEAVGNMPDFLSFPVTEQEHTNYKILLTLHRNMIVESIMQHKSEGVT